MTPFTYFLSTPSFSKKFASNSPPIPFPSSDFPARMASGPGRARGGIRIQEPVNVHREESHSAAAAAEPHLPAPPFDGAHGPPVPGARGQNPSADVAASASAAAKRKGKKVMAPSPTSSEGSKSPVSSGIVSVSGAGGSSPAETQVDGGGRSNVSWKNPLVEGIMEVPKVTRHIDLQEVFDNVLLQRQWNETEEMEMKQWQQQGKPPTIWPEKVHKKSLWSKFKGGMENMFSESTESQIPSSQDSTVMVPHVNQQTIPMSRIIEHYELIEVAAGRGVIFHSNALNLRRTYSEFRPVHGDGECFYLSFLFSYLEQVLDRHDTHEEYRLLAAVKEVARQMQHARLGWTSEFSWRHKAFKMLIKKVMRWKRHSRWKRAPTTSSYRKQKLLKFFSDYVRTNDIFTFLRLVAAIWICSHSEEFEPLVLPELNEDYTLRDWCSREVIHSKVFTDHVQMTALVTALGVPLRLEYLLQGAGQDFYTGKVDSQDDTPSTCWPHCQYQTPHGHAVPYVTVLYTNAHYDIIYPHFRDVRSIDGRCSQQTAQVQRPTAASVGQKIAQGESWSGADSSHRIIQGESSTGVRIQINTKCTRKLPLTGAHEYDEHRSIAE